MKRSIGDVAVRVGERAVEHPVHDGIEARIHCLDATDRRTHRFAWRDLLPSNELCDAESVMQVEVDHWDSWKELVKTWLVVDSLATRLQLRGMKHIPLLLLGLVATPALSQPATNPERLA